jgi:hypothetical protein
MCLTDTSSSYFYNVYIYVGKDSNGTVLSNDEQGLAKPTQSVIRLQWTNIADDNWFSSAQVVQLVKNRRPTYVGTLRNNKREILREFLANRSRE